MKRRFVGGGRNRTIFLEAAQRGGALSGNLERCAALLVARACSWIPNVFSGPLCSLSYK